MGEFPHSEGKTHKYADDEDEIDGRVWGGKSKKGEIRARFFLDLWSYSFFENFREQGEIVKIDDDVYIIFFRIERLRERETEREKERVGERGLSRWKVVCACYRVYHQYFIPQY